MAFSKRFNFPNRISIGLTGNENISRIPKKGVLIKNPLVEQPLAWIAETNDKRADLIYDYLAAALNGDEYDYASIKWDVEFAELNKPTEPKKAQ